jgi:hypothetical protein
MKFSGATVHFTLNLEHVTQRQTPFRPFVFKKLIYNFTYALINISSIFTITKVLKALEGGDVELPSADTFVALSHFVQASDGHRGSTEENHGGKKVQTKFSHKP